MSKAEVKIVADGIEINVTVVVPDAPEGQDAIQVSIPAGSTVGEAVAARDAVVDDKVGDLKKVGLAADGQEVSAETVVEDKATVTAARKPVHNG